MEERSVKGGSPGVGEESVGGRSARRKSTQLNRELSDLDFDARVLALASSARVPLLERVKFLAIFASNVDEFFQVRVAGLKDQVEAGLEVRSPDGLSASEQLALIREKVGSLSRQAEEVFLESVRPELEAHGVSICDHETLEPAELEWSRRFFRERVFPIVTPLSVDPGHPFPYISNLSLNLGVMVGDPQTSERRFARVKVPTNLPRFVGVGESRRLRKFVPLEQLIAANLDLLFPGMEIASTVPFRVTRNTDLTFDAEEAEDLLELVELEVRRRRFGRAVRLEIAPNYDEGVVELLQRELQIGPEDVYVCRDPLGLSDLMQLAQLDLPELKYAPFKPVTPHLLVQQADIFEVIRRQDLLVHHPYESFSETTEEFLSRAATDPKVLAIKSTIYRTSGGSPIVAALARAAEAGKQVAVLVELKARFDEAANIEWARELENAGCHVAYGFPDLKIHAKAALVVREESDGLVRYCHVGTGNYNPATARSYEDLGLLTCDAAIADDLSHLFNYLTGFAKHPACQKLLVAPQNLRKGLQRLIRQEMDAEDGRIVIKANNLTDAQIIDLLYEASRHGVQIDLIIRSICCLIPQVPGLSENIRVRSIVGRFLEHSRIWYFANGRSPGEPLYLLGSADIMPRNLDHRVEIMVPVESPELCDRLSTILTAALSDDVNAWELDAEGVWSPVPCASSFDSQEYLRQSAEDLAKNGRIDPGPASAPIEATPQMEVPATLRTDPRWCPPSAEAESPGHIEGLDLAEGG
ncbi:MAG: polyphosphate kinase [Acidimicrobiales bacterium]|nr:MAG: polyphosphate kinase [Acidimicrobiales bacterium]